MTMPGFSADMCLGRRGGYRPAGTPAAGNASLVMPASMTVCSSDTGLCYEETTAAGYISLGAFAGAGIGTGIEPGGGSLIGGLIGGIACAFDSDCHF
jgi:hypothetical protein